MAKTIPQLTDATTVNAADELIIQQGGITKRATGAELAKGLNTINGTVNVKDFGAVGDGVADNLAAFNNALAAAAATRSAVFVPAGDYNISGQLVFPSTQGVTMYGPSKASAGGLNEGATRLLFNHVGTPAVRLTKDNQCLSNILIGGYGSRTSANAGSIGLLVEGEDTATGAARSCHIYGVTVRDQGGSGFVTSGNVNHTRFDSCTSRTNRGHAWVLSEGSFTSRTNTERVGQVVVRDCRAFDNAGHHILCYDEGFGAYRLLVENFESSNYATYHDATLFVKPASTVINGENVILTACAFAGSVGSTRTYASLWVSGRVVRSIATRHISPSSPAVIVGMDSIKDPADILIDGLFVDQGWTSGDPFVHIETGVRGVTIVSRNPDQVSNPVSGDTTGAVIHTSTVSFNRLITDTNKLQILASPNDTPIDIARADFGLGITLTRTGAGATTGRVACVGNTLTLSTTTDNNVVMQRNADAARQITVKSNTINMLTLPTSASGLVAGDLWNDGGTVKIIT